MATRLVARTREPTARFRASWNSWWLDEGTTIKVKSAHLGTSLATRPVTIDFVRWPSRGRKRCGRLGYWWILQTLKEKISIPVLCILMSCILQDSSSTQCSMVESCGVTRESVDMLMDMECCRDTLEPCWSSESCFRPGVCQFVTFQHSITDMDHGHNSCNRTRWTRHFFGILEGSAPWLPSSIVLWQRGWWWLDLKTVRGPQIVAITRKRWKRWSCQIVSKPKHTETIRNQRIQRIQRTWTAGRDKSVCRLKDCHSANAACLDLQLFGLNWICIAGCTEIWQMSFAFVCHDLICAWNEGGQDPAAWRLATVELETVFQCHRHCESVRLKCEIFRTAPLFSPFARQAGKAQNRVLSDAFNTNSHHLRYHVRYLSGQYHIKSIQIV